MARWSQWLSDRFGWGPIRKALFDRRVPSVAWYQGDGFTIMVLLGVVVLTGMFMTLTYTPTPDGAYESVRFITERQVMGWFIRAMHYWAAGMMVVMVFFHLFRVLLVAGYKFPREGTYLIGVVMLFFVLLMSITGYMLRWDERAIFALNVVLHHLSNVPWIGEHLVVLALGGSDIGAQTLTRIYSIHVIFVPLLLLGLVGYHMYLVIIKGVTSKAERREPVHTIEQQKRLYDAESQSEERGEAFFPDTVVNSGRLGLTVFTIVLLLAIFAGPKALYPEANLSGDSITAEEWWFWWYSALIAVTPPWLAPVLVVALPLLAFAVLCAIPFIDRGPLRGIRARPRIAVAVAVTVLVMLGLTNYRYFSPWTGWPRLSPPALPAGVEISPVAEEGRQLFATYGCNSCHAVAGDGARVAVDLARRDSLMTSEELEMYILSPPEGISMPAYEGRLTPDELQRIMEFVLVAQTFPRQ